LRFLADRQVQRIQQGTVFDSSRPLSYFVNQIVNIEELREQLHGERTVHPQPITQKRRLRKQLSETWMVLTDRFTQGQ
jgi:hypothetical protein